MNSLTLIPNALSMQFMSKNCALGSVEVHYHDLTALISFETNGPELVVESIHYM